MDFLAKIFRNVLPFFIYKYLYIIWPEQKRLREEEERTRPERERALAEHNRIHALTSRNAELKDRHRGERCFILCNGPSVRRQNIRPLKDELVMSVSSGYLHPDYTEIAPAYHCVPQITYGMMTRSDVIAWFREMHDRLGAATLILSQTEEALIREENLFAGRDVRYVHLSGRFSDYPPEQIPDLTTSIPAVQSVPVLGLMIAAYMGAKPLYLLGTDHDHFRSGEYKYFYEPTVLRGKDMSTDEHGKLRSGWHDELSGLAALWSQYRSIRQIATSNGIEIFNATHGGELDEFSRVELDSLFPIRRG
ncbi:hypothetical protein MTR72_39145 [Bradyrhizobium sp. ISRA442]|uniref:hypothetical protein n=1 Tax=Bradyrhizobium sp. ISRA442 TaxID=2866197 RepID=UPI00311ABF04